MKYLVIEFRENPTLLESDLKNANSPLIKNWKQTVIPACNAFEGFEGLSTAYIVDHVQTTGQKITLPVTGERVAA